MSDNHIKERNSSGAINHHPDVILTSEVWKRRSGFVQFSENMIGAGSWERRNITLHHDVTSKKSNPRICYYACDDRDQKNPRGTIMVNSERPKVWANHHPSDGSQPTPYSLSILPDGGTKWKFCFDDRETQMAWLIALTDSIVDGSVQKYNLSTLANDATKRDHEGFHRLYLEGEGRLFNLVRNSLLDVKPHIKGLILERSMKSFCDEIEVVGVDSVQQQQQQAEGLIEKTKLSKFISIDSSTQTPINELLAADDGLGIYVSQERLYRALLVINLSFVYVLLTSQSTSYIAIPRWQLLIFLNAATYYVCTANNCTRNENVDLHSSSLEPASSQHPSVILSTRNEIIEEHIDAEPDVKTVQSAYGKSSLQSTDVPCSDVPLESTQKNELDDISCTSQSRCDLTLSVAVLSSDVSSETTQRNELEDLACATQVHSDHPQSVVVPYSEAQLQSTQENELEELSCRTQTYSDPLTEEDTHERWAISAPDCDLSGSWTLIADDSFKDAYSKYLQHLGFNVITRSVACSLVNRTTEITKQAKSGRELYLKDVNPKGVWERVLFASGYPDFDTNKKRSGDTDYNHIKTPVKTADAEKVIAEAWWEQRGTRHRSWLRGGTKYGGGDFESLRYLEEGSDGKVLVCESIFHPNDARKTNALVKWRFLRNK